MGWLKVTSLGDVDATLDARSTFGSAFCRDNALPIGFEETDKKQKDFQYATAKSYLVTDVCASAQSQFLTQKNDALEIWLYGVTSILS